MDDLSKLLKHLIELLESDLLGVLSKESSTDVHVILSDDTIVGSGDSAASATFSASSGMGVPDVLMSHVQIFLGFLKLKFGKGYKT